MTNREGWPVESFTTTCIRWNLCMVITTVSNKPSEHHSGGVIPCSAQLTVRMETRLEMHIRELVVSEQKMLWI